MTTVRRFSGCRVRMFGPNCRRKYVVPRTICVYCTVLYVCSRCGVHVQVHVWQPLRCCLLCSCCCACYRQYRSLYYVHMILIHKPGSEFKFGLARSKRVVDAAEGSHAGLELTDPLVPHALHLVKLRKHLHGAAARRRGLRERGGPTGARRGSRREQPTKLP